MTTMRITESKRSMQRRGAPVEVTRIEADFDMRDERGRALGGSAEIHEAEDGKHVEIDTPDGRDYQWIGNGERVTWLHMSATRDGKDFGASQRGVKCRTREEAVDLAHRKFAAQAARYAKRSK